MIQLTDEVREVPERATPYGTYIHGRSPHIEFAYWQGTGWGIPMRVDVYRDGNTYYATCRGGKFRIDGDELREELASAD